LTQDLCYAVGFNDGNALIEEISKCVVSTTVDTVDKVLLSADLASVGLGLARLLAAAGGLLRAVQ
jgi:hypothetical protein